MKIRVNQSPEFRRAVAVAVVTEADSSHGGRQYYYADPEQGKVYCKEVGNSNKPWRDSIDYRIVGVQDLVEQENNDFDPQVDWKIVDIPECRNMVAAFLESKGEEFEANGDIPEWVSVDEVIAFVREHSDTWRKWIEEQEAVAFEEAVCLAKVNILNEIEIEDES